MQLIIRQGRLSAALLSDVTLHARECGNARHSRPRKIDNRYPGNLWRLRAALRIYISRFCYVRKDARGRCRAELMRFNPFKQIDLTADTNEPP